MTYGIKKGKWKKGYIITQKDEGKYVFFAGQYIYSKKENGEIELNKTIKENPKLEFKLKKVEYY